LTGLTALLRRAGAPFFKADLGRNPRRSGKQLPSQIADNRIQGTFIYKPSRCRKNEPKFNAQACLTSREFWISGCSLRSLLRRG
jgi:hypothetical protein